MPLIPPAVAQGMALADYRAALARQLRNRSDITTPLLDLFINWAYQDMAADLHLPETQVSVETQLVDEVHEYDIPSELLIIQGAAVRNDLYDPPKSHDLDPMSIDDYRARPIRYGPPTNWFRQGRKIVLWPYPQGDELFLVLDGIGIVDKLTNEAHSPVFNVTLHRLMLILARSYAYDDSGQPDKAAIAYNTYLSGLRSKVDTLAEERAYSSPRVIVPRSEDHLRSVMTGEDWYDALLE